MAINAGLLDPLNRAVSFMIDCADQAEIDRLWNALSKDGSTEACGWLKDRYGLSWQIVPTILGEMIKDPDRARAKRVTEAMLKIDIAGLKKAYDGKQGARTRDAGDRPPRKLRSAGSPPAARDPLRMLALKLALAPTLILIASLAARRWGVLVAGWIAGFPLTSGPVSIFLAVEQGHDFAATAARGTLVGVIAMIGFCLAYARLAPAHGAVVSLAGGLFCLLLLAAVLFALAPALPATLGLLAAALLVSLAAVPRVAVRPAPAPPPWWDIPARMTVAVGLVVGLTEFADRLGPDLSGLISPVPIFASVLAVFTHRHQGGTAAAELLRGVILGNLSFSAFFLVVALALGPLGLIATYGLAALVSALVNFAALGWDRTRVSG